MQRHIVLAWYDTGDFLTGPRNANPNGLWRRPDAGECAVVESFTHPDSVASMVEADERDKDQVQPGDGNARCVMAGFLNAESIDDAVR